MKSKRLEGAAIVIAVAIVCTVPLLFKKNLNGKSIAKKSLDVKAAFAALERGR